MKYRNLNKSAPSTQTGRAKQIKNKFNAMQMKEWSTEKSMAKHLII